MKHNEKINLRFPSDAQDFDGLFGFFWNHGIGNHLAKNGDPVPWTAETLESACETAGKRVDRRTIQNWRSGKNQPGRRNLHILARVAGAGDETHRRRWADALIATLTAPKSDIPSPPVAAAQSESLASNMAAAARLKQKRRLSALAGAVGVTLLAYALLRSDPPVAAPSNAAKSPTTVAVIPFEDFSAERSLDYFASGMVDDVIHALAQLDDIRVTPRRDTAALDATNLSITQIGETLNADFILDGSIREVDTRLKVNASLIRVADGEHVWTGKFDDPSDDIFTIQSQMGDGIAEALNIYLSPDRRARMFEFGTSNIEAYRHYLKGRHVLKYWHEDKTGDGVWEAGEYLTAAADSDPEFAKAWFHQSDAQYHFAAGHVGQPATDFDTFVPKTAAEAAGRLQYVLGRAAELEADPVARQQAALNAIFFSRDWTELRAETVAFAEAATTERGELEWLFAPVILTLLGEGDVLNDLMTDRVLKFDPNNGTGLAYCVRASLTAGDYAAAQAKLDAASAMTFSARLDEVRGYLLYAQGDMDGLRAHVTSAQNLSPMLHDYFHVLLLHAGGDPTGAMTALDMSQSLRQERVHFAVALNHIGEHALSQSIFEEISAEPIGPMLIAVVLSYGAACGPESLKMSNALKRLLDTAGAAPLPCIGQANGRLSDSQARMKVFTEKR